MLLVNTTSITKKLKIIPRYIFLLKILTYKGNIINIKKKKQKELIPISVGPRTFDQTSVCVFA